jgi:predicted XRE-type DNA-binding protein
MSSDTSGISEQPTVAGATPKRPREMVMPSWWADLKHVSRGADSTAIPPATSPSDSADNSGPPAATDHDYPAGEPHGTEQNPVYDSAALSTNAAIMAARRTLITAITQRITQKRLAAAQAAAVTHLTGPRVTKLLNGRIDEFTLEELVNLLPALELTIQVVPEPERYAGHSGH